MTSVIELLPGTAFPGYEVIPDKPRAALVVVHGIAEHGGRYRHVADALARHDIASFVYDQRGHGRNLRARSQIDDFAGFAHDLNAVAASLRERHAALPFFVWGHSMGSVVSILAALDGLAGIAGVITSGCALDALPSLGGWRGLGLRMANTLLPRLRITLRIDASRLTQVQDIQRAHMSDPLVPRSASLRLLYGFAAACETCKAGLPTIHLPWLAIHGTADEVCPVSGSERLIAALGSSDKQLVLYPRLLHEPHNEDEAARAQMFELMARWMLARVVASRLH